MYYIEIQKIISNAFINSLEHSGPRKFSFKSLMDYASAAVEELVKEGRRSFLLLSKDRQEKFFNTYRDIFAIEGEKVVLTGNMDAASLADKVDYATSWEVFLALKSDRALSALGLAKEKKGVIQSLL